MLGLAEVVLVAAILITIFVAYYIFKGKNASLSPTSSKPAAPTTVPVVPAAADNHPKETDKSSDSDKPLMNIFYGSQSGTAETFATELAEEAKVFGFNAKAIDLEEYDHETQLSTEKFAVFLLATFGEGEPTDNAASFYEWVMSDDREEGSLSGVEFAVFALGNKQYEHYCAIGRRVDKRLGEMGASRLLKVGEGDDDGSLEDDYTAWKNKFWKKARGKFIQGAGDLDVEQAPKDFEPSFKITVFPPRKRSRDQTEDAEPEKDGVDEKSVDKEEEKQMFKRTPVYQGGLEGFQQHGADPKLKAELATVLVNRELRSDVSDGGSTRHLELDISKLRLRYLTADNLGVFPRNDFKLAGKLAKRLGMHPDTIFTLERTNDENKKKPPVPSPCSVRDALLWYCDVTVHPRSKLLVTLAQYATDEKEKQRLLNWAAADKEAFASDVMSLWEVLEACPSVQPPFVDFLEFVPKLQPRYYTISSSSKAHPTAIHITVSLLTKNKPRDRVETGVCTSYLCSMREGDKVCVFVRPSSFRLPTKPVPIIMVGPGTGLAPFRGFIQEARTLRAKLEKREKEGKKTEGESLLGPMTLFFGCRRREHDFIYSEELLEAEKEGVLSKLVLAFSRESGERKVYVQNRMAEHDDWLWNALSAEGGYFYVCGGTSMGRSVREELVAIAQQKGGLSNEQAIEFVAKLQTDGRYIQELWA